MAQQTAVDWLKKELEDFGDSTHLRISWVILDELCEQANRMFEKQIIDAASDHCYPTYELAKIDAEEYYNKTFKIKII